MIRFLLSVWLGLFFLLFPLSPGQGSSAGDSPAVETPTLVESLRSQPVSWVQCGSDHCLAVTATGCLYTWGAGQNYQLGNERDVMFRRSPFLVNPSFFEEYAVLQVGISLLSCACRTFPCRL